MPMIRITTATELPEAQAQELLQDISQAVARVLGKPEQYVMAVWAHAHMWMAGGGGPAAFVELDSIGGLGSAVNRRLSALLADALARPLGIPAERVYVRFADVAAADWGWNKSTFG